MQKITEDDLLKHWLWETSSYSEIMTIYAHQIKKKSTYIIVGCPHWNLHHGWHGIGLCFWGNKRLWNTDYECFVYTAEETVAILNQHEAQPIDDKMHLEVVPNNKERPPESIRQLFGKMAHDEKEAGLPPTWQNLRKDWKEGQQQEKEDK